MGKQSGSDGVAMRLCRVRRVCTVHWYTMSKQSGDGPAASAAWPSASAVAMSVEPNARARPLVS